MKVVEISTNGVIPAIAGKASHPTKGSYWRIIHGQEGRGRKLVVFPLGARDFPGTGTAPGPKQEYRLVPISSGHYILAKGQDDGTYLVLWSLSPGFRGSASYCVDGEAEVIAEGREAQGLAGGMGGAPCPVVLVTGPCTLRWERRGRLYGTPAKWRAVYDGQGWTVVPDDGVSDAVEAAFDF